MFNRNSKADTRFLGDSDLGDLFSDQSQWAGDLADNTTYYTSTDARLAVRSPRELAMVVEVKSDDAGILLHWGKTDGTQYIYKIAANGAGSIQFSDSGSLLALVPLPGVTGTASPYLIHWSTDYDPVRETWYSELALCRLATGAWEVRWVEHAQPQATQIGWQLNVIGYGAGLSPFSGGVAAFRQIRIGCRYHSTTEAKEDWVDESTSPIVTGYAPPVELAPTSGLAYEPDQDSDIGDAILDPETFAGPSEWITALHSGAMRQRLYGPILNVICPSPQATIEHPPVPANLFRQVGTSRWAGIHHLWIRPVPIPPGQGGLYARVRVHVQTWVAAGAPPGTTPRLEVELRSSSSVSMEASTSTPVTTCTTDHTSTGIGEWLELGELPIQVKPGFGITFLNLTVSLGLDAHTGVAYRRARIKAVTADLYVQG